MQQRRSVILCIDDDQDILAALKIVLESKGYTVVTASSAAEGLDAYSRVHPDLLIVDLMMERIDSGLTVVERLHAAGNTKPILFLSSTGDYLQGTTDLSSAGVSGVFQKPVEPDLLLSLVARHLKVTTAH